MYKLKTQCTSNERKKEKVSSKKLEENIAEPKELWKNLKKTLPF